jgi:hypothetical protein
LVTEKYGFHQLQSFLRGLAAQDGGPKNINDLPEEGTDKLREVTIRYKDLEWSFSCARNDFTVTDQDRISRRIITSRCDTAIGW